MIKIHYIPIWIFFFNLRGTNCGDLTGTLGTVEVCTQALVRLPKQSLLVSLCSNPFLISLSLADDESLCSQKTKMHQHMHIPGQPNNEVCPTLST